MYCTHVFLLSACLKFKCQITLCRSGSRVQNTKKQNWSFPQMANSYLLPWILLCVYCASCASPYETRDLSGIQRTLSSIEMMVKQITGLVKNNYKPKKENYRPTYRPDYDSKCPHPWEIYKGMCLLYSKEKKAWNDANKFCKKHGGHLAWLVDGSEHDLAREFFNMKSGDHAYCYIGLHRSGGTVQWTGFNSPYRGNLKYIKENYLYFRLYYKSRAIYGTHPDSSEEFLCRRA